MILNKRLPMSGSKLHVVQRAVVFLSIVIMLGGCSQKVAIRVLEPSEIERAALTKKLSVSEFNNDTIGLSNKIEAQLANKKIDNKSYFTMISRKDFKKIIDEQKIQNSGLINISDAVEVGNLIGAEAIISGNVSNVFPAPEIACIVVMIISIGSNFIKGAIAGR